MQREAGYYNSPIGWIEIIEDGNSVTYLRFLDQIEHIDHEAKNSRLISIVISQLEEYFNNKRRVFDLPVHISGTDFQEKVWKQLLQIPYGTYKTYGKIATELGTKKCVRAVGNANGKNPIAIIVPCHRVIGENNKLVGYAGGLWRKKWLLEHEAENKQLSCF